MTLKQYRDLQPGDVFTVPWAPDVICTVTRVGKVTPRNRVTVYADTYMFADEDFEESRGSSQQVHKANDLVEVADA